VCVGDKFKSGRYRVLSKLGWGHFSTVWLCSDAQTGKDVALKARSTAQRTTRRTGGGMGDGTRRARAPLHACGVRG